MSSGGREMESDRKSDIAGGKTVGAHPGFSERGWGSWISHFKQETRLNALMSCKVVTWRSCSWTASAITVLCWGITSMRRDWESKKRCVNALSKTGYWIAAGIPPEFDAGISIIQMSSDLEKKNLKFWWRTYYYVLHQNFNDYAYEHWSRPTSLKSPKSATLHLNTQKSMRWIPTFFQVASFFSLLTFLIVLRACSCAIASSSLLDETPSLLHQLYFISTHNFSLCFFALFSFRLPSSSLSICLCLINYHWQWFPYSDASTLPSQV